jgi:hypothetical protein
MKRQALFNFGLNCKTRTSLHIDLQLVTEKKHNHNSMYGLSRVSKQNSHVKVHLKLLKNFFYLLR